MRKALREGELVAVRFGAILMYLLGALMLVASVSFAEDYCFAMGPWWEGFLVCLMLTSIAAVCFISAAKTWRT